MKKNYITYICI